MRVLVALDRTERAAEAARAIARWASEAKPEIHLLHVIHPDHIPETAAPRGFVHSLTPGGTVAGQPLDAHEPYARLAEDRSQALARATAESDDFLHEIRATYFPEMAVFMHVAPSEHTAREIVRQAKLIGADFVAMASRERSGLGQRIFGSVHEEVVRACSVPVLVVGPEVTAGAN
ncbi:MAG: universal stress protein [Dehalococcoidia bacterium]